jgi:hypothetical protein
MPSSTASTSSNTPLSPSELSTILFDHSMVELITNVFSDEPRTVDQLRYYSYISQNITRLEAELDRHRQEREELFDHILRDEATEDTMRPIVRTYRRRTRRSGFCPYTHQPLANEIIRTPTPFPPATSSSRSSRNPSQSSSSDDSSSSSPSPYMQPGSSEYPINVDANPQPDIHLDPITMKKPYVRSDEDAPRFKPTCARCGQFGHEKPDCDTKMRSFDWENCEICAWRNSGPTALTKGLRQRMCDHYDVTPVDIKKLRGNIPYDEEE